MSKFQFDDNAGEAIIGSMLGEDDGASAAEKTLSKHIKGGLKGDCSNEKPDAGEAETSNLDISTVLGGVDAGGAAAEDDASTLDLLGVLTESKVSGLQVVNSACAGFNPLLSMDNLPSYVELDIQSLFCEGCKNRCAIDSSICPGCELIVCDDYCMSNGDGGKCIRCSGNEPAEKEKTLKTAEIKIAKEKGIFTEEEIDMLIGAMGTKDKMSWKAFCQHLDNNESPPSYPKKGVRSWTAKLSQIKSLWSTGPGISSHTRFSSVYRTKKGLQYCVEKCGDEYKWTNEFPPVNSAGMSCRNVKM